MTVHTVATVRVRPAMPADLPVCAALDHTTETDYVWQMERVELDGHLTVTFRSARLPRTMRVVYPRPSAALQATWEADTGFLVAESGNKLVGYINMRERPAYQVAWVTDLAVDANYRGQGIGTQLLTRARTLARERGFQRIIVETATKNHPAICFLQNNGLALCGYNDLYYPNHDIALLFGRSLR